MLDFLKGKKTYILAAGASLTAIGGYLSGIITLPDLLQSLFIASGFGTLRAGVKTEVQNTLTSKKK